MKSAEIRESFLGYFEKHDHRRVQSSSLVPIDDPTLLFSNAGMNQFKAVFTGHEQRPYKRATSSQKCIRAGGKHNDLENVGETARHHTFFEMLGNFSFGDYFKAEAIEFAWEWSTKYIGLPADRLWVSIFEDDDEAFELWEKIVPELKGRVLRFNEKENYWSMGDIGPNGPCSELHFDRGEKYGTGPDDVVNGETDRFVEIYNLVFMQFNKDEAGNVAPLPKPSVDTGAGLERIACILQNGETNYETDLFMPIIHATEELTGQKYSDKSSKLSFRVIADHIRALTFAFSDGAVPSNDGRGYVLRRILRRAARHGRILGVTEPFIYKLTDTVADNMGDAYPELKTRLPQVTELIKSEEEKFNQTLDTGLSLFSNVARRIESQGSDTIPGEDVFTLYDTYGFPVDLTEVMARERNLHVDMAGFEKCMEEQKQRSKDARGSVNFVVTSYDAETEFAGYDDAWKLPVKVLSVKSRDDGSFEVLLDRTPFYAESGGQIGDTGVLEADGLRFEVTDTQKAGEAILHIGKNAQGDINDFVNKEITAIVDGDRQKATQRNHTATHLLHKALREVLGEHVQQAGSMVAPDRFRFDFSHFKAVTDDEIREIERRVNRMILQDYPVNWDVMPIEEAKEAGAMALFGEKYGDEVRMVQIGDGVSRELCGGTHVHRTGEIGMMVITQETAIAAGMRRMEAVTGEGAYNLTADYRANLTQLANMLKVTPEDIAERVEGLSRKLKEQQKELKKARQSEGDQKIKEHLGDLKQKGDFFYRVAEVENRGEAQQYLDNVKADKRAIVIGLKQDSSYFVTVSGTAAKSGKSAKEVIARFNEAFSGRGGGKDTFAQGGTKENFTLKDLEKVLADAL